MRSSARLPLEMLAPYLLEVRHPRKPAPTDALPPYSGRQPLSWSELFGNGHPVEIEIGFGKGLFLLNASEARPEHNFLGIEKERPYTMMVATRLAKRQRSNVRLACADARWFLQEWIAARSVHAVHIYFPDPWWKKRHHKRRLFNESFTQRLVEILIPDGRLHFATDVPDYFEMTMAMLRKQATILEMPAPTENAPRHEMDYLTNFERKFRRQQKAIFRALFARTR